MRTLYGGLPVALLTACAHHNHLFPKDLLEANFEAMQEAVAANVPDTERVARINKSINDLRQQLLSFQADRNRFQSDLLALNARPDVTRAELEARIQQFNNGHVAPRAQRRPCSTFAL